MFPKHRADLISCAVTVQRMRSGDIETMRVPANPLDVLAQHILGTACAGPFDPERLFQEVRENRGLCYAVHTFASGYADTGLFGIYAGTSPKDLPELLRVVAAETEKLLDEASEDEVARARAQIKAALLMGQESCANVCGELATQLLYFNRRVPTAETIAKLDAVDAAAVKRPATLVTLGPVGRKMPEVGFDKLAA